MLHKKLTLAATLFGSLILNTWAQQEQPFTVSGTIYNLPKQKIYLVKSEVHISKVDSIEIDSIHNTFVLHGKDHEESLYEIWGSKSNFNILLALKGGDAVKVTSTYNINDKDLKGKQRLHIEGSRTSSELLTYDILDRKLLGQIDNLRDKLDSLKTRTHNEEQVNQIKNQLRTVCTQVFDLGSAHVRKQISPVNVYIGLIRCNIYTDYYPEINRQKQMEELIAFAQNAYPTSTPVKIIVDGYKRAVERKINHAALVGQTKPPILLPDTTGKQVSSQLAGKYVLLDFWASWCKPCRQESPHLLEAYRQFKNKNFTIYSISLDDKKEPWLAAIRKDKTGLWTHVIDTDAGESRFIKEYAFAGIPATYLLDPQGKIIALDLRGKELLETLKKILN